ncbi:sec-independent protein translocase protein TatC [Prevotella sp. tc2-28]|jgi:sec-independent protein translocase protein TatC|uniref:twin-arginine translocase subunit TatC n=1 Tax=Prevotella sp. tc2-28 TaxID=1761888 RepID=UPI000898BB3C|nr:twin-arginine translocase subunit TatC [Prevotella sp. tc2-28]SDZ90811.1 sec-independent protein translocase protein TatC [Prevotella sp. tc2-28]
MTEPQTFWDHLDVLRASLIRMAIVVTGFTVVAFLMKDTLFSIVLAPRSSHFVTYQLLGAEVFTLHLMNTGLTEQFMIHVRTALYAGVLLASPYILYELFRFVSPGLYANERRYTVWIVGAAYLMFIIGTFVNYFVVFPMTVHFLGTYQVSPDVANMLTLQSYIDTLLGMSLIMGVVFELPVVCAVMGRMGLITNRMMTAYRRHAIVAILVVAAIITPTTDIFTLMVVSLPIYLLYELSIQIVRITKKN